MLLRRACTDQIANRHNAPDLTCYTHAEGTVTSSHGLDASDLRKMPTIALGIEGSANKIGVGVVTDEGLILANPRHTYVYDCRHRQQLPEPS